MPARYHEQIRWLVVYKRVFLGDSQRDVSDALLVGRRFQRDVLRLFWSTGNVVAPRADAPSQSVLTPQLEIALLHDVLDAPRATLNQRAATLQLAHGVTVSVSTVCRAMRRLRLSKQVMQHYALRRDDLKAQAFWCEIVTFYSLDDLLVGDETAKCVGCMRSQRGWGQMGVTPYDRDVTLSRGRRVSALTYFSTRGFEDWRFTRNTYNAPRFQSATDEMLLTEDATGTTLASRFLLLLLDNASIHKDDAYLRRLRRHIDVKFIPPYCYHLSPLDNGAYGCTRAPFGRVPASLDWRFSDRHPHARAQTWCAFCSRHPTTTAACPSSAASTQAFAAWTRRRHGTASTTASATSLRMCEALVEADIGCSFGV